LLTAPELALSCDKARREIPTEEHATAHLLNLKIDFKFLFPDQAESLYKSVTVF
jgi:hypothetical protein